MPENTSISRRNPFPIYPLFLAVYPILALYGNNIDEVAANVIWRPFVLSLLVGIIVWALVHAIMREIHRSASYTAIVLLGWFVYGHAFMFLRSSLPLGSEIGWHLVLLPFAVLALGLAFWWIWLKMPSTTWPAQLLNPISAFLLIYPLIQTTSYLYAMARSERVQQQELPQNNATLPHGYAPDIYYFILDAYGRNDVLQDSLGYDNSSFTKSLKEMGFYVAECSQSNYSITVLSLGSSLNLDYMQALGADGKETSKSVRPGALVVNNTVRNFLKDDGYRIVSFENGYIPSRWKSADYFLIAPSDYRANDFEWLFVETTATRIYFDLFSRSPEDRTRQTTRDRTLFALEQFDRTIPDIASPKFVFAHLIIPHPPYVFGPNGETPSEALDEGTAYIGQVRYINDQMVKIVQKILKNSENPPIIIIQGDHGPAGKLLENPTDRLKILNAYYLPEGSGKLYSTITPVNSFRMIFNEFFGSNYEPLQDISLRSVYGDPFNFSEVPNQCQP